jgi:hypothetical protein
MSRELFSGPFNAATIPGSVSGELRRLSDYGD